MAKYRKKPVVVEAFQFHAAPAGSKLPNYADWPEWAKGNMYHWLDDGMLVGRGGKKTLVVFPGHLDVYTLEGIMRAGDGDWIIKGMQGEVYPCKPDIFEATYEPAEED